MGKNNETTKPQNENEQTKTNEQTNEQTTQTLSERLKGKLEQINETITSEQNTKCLYYEKISTNNKYLYFTKQTRNELENAGLNLEQFKYNYIKYSDAPNSYNTILNIFQTNADIFKKRAEK